MQAKYAIQCINKNTLNIVILLWFLMTGAWISVSGALMFIDLPFILNLLKESAHLRLKVCASSLFLKRYADYYTQLETSLYSSHQMNNYRTHELLYRHEEIVENFFQHLFNSESFYKLTPFHRDLRKSFVDVYNIQVSKLKFVYSNQ